MAEEAKRCFIAMPITTPEGSATAYGGDPDHFLHVLEHLFVPAIKAAGYTAVKPIMEGADLIQAEIVRNLEQCDMVLCDLSALNPNVFFEVGIRTALDRPLALVRDDGTERLPFDTGILNTHTYKAALSPWTLEGEIEALSAHIAASARRCDGQNPLWKYFGLTQRAESDSVSTDPVSAKLDLLLARSDMEAHRISEVESTLEGLTRSDLRGRSSLSRPWPSQTVSADNLPSGLPSRVSDFLTSAANIAQEVGARFWFDGYDPVTETVVLDQGFYKFDSKKRQIDKLAKNHALQVEYISDRLA